jgi:hypothetical protein
MAYQLMQDCNDMHCEMSSTEHAVLMVLCRYADEQGNNCFPSTAEIARCSHFAVLPVRKAIAGLELSGWITSRQEAGKKRFFTVNAQKIRGSLPLANQDGGINQHPRIDQYGGTNQDGGINQHLDPVSIDTPTPYQSIPRKEHIKEQEKDREENAPASNPESGTCDVTASDLCPSVDAFALSGETPQAAEKTKKGKKAKKGNAEEVDFYDLPESMIRDWKTHRGTTAKITQTVVDAFRREAEKVGKTLEFAVRYSIEHNWRGFFAKWYLKEEAKSGGESISNVGTLPDQSRNPFYFPDGGRPNRKTTEVPRDYDATAEASDLVGRMLG